MTESSIKIVMQRLTEASEVGNVAKVVAVRPMGDQPGNVVAINRMFHEVEDHNVHDVVVATIYADTFAELETIGSQVHACLKDSDDPEGAWDCGEARDVQFTSTGSDTTGWDGEREQFLRSIEFEVSW